MLIVKGKRPYVCPSYKNVIAFKNIYELSELVKEYLYLSKFESAKLLSAIFSWSREEETKIV